MLQNLVHICLGWWYFLVNCPFYWNEVSLGIFSVGFSLKSVLLGIRTEKPACFLIPFCWSSFIHPCTLRQCPYLKIWCVASCRQQTDRFGFLPSMCILIKELRPLIFKVIVEMYLWVAVIMVLILGVVFSVVLCVLIIMASCFSLQPKLLVPVFPLGLVFVYVFVLLILWRGFLSSSIVVGRWLCCVN